MLTHDNPSLNLIDLDRIEGWYPNPLDIHPFQYLKFKTPATAPGAVMQGRGSVLAGARAAR